MFTILIHFCERAFGINSINDHRNTGSDAISLPSQNGYNSSDEKEQTMIVDQPKLVENSKIYLRHRTDSMESDITGLGKNLTSILTKDCTFSYGSVIFKAQKPLQPATNVTRSAGSSQENLLSISKSLVSSVLNYWTPQSMRKQMRQWAPVKFYPVAQKNQNEDSLLLSGQRAQSQSAPTTPIPTKKRNVDDEFLSPTSPKVELFVERSKRPSPDSQPIITIHAPQSTSIGLQKSGNKPLFDESHNLSEMSVSKFFFHLSNCCTFVFEMTDLVSAFFVFCCTCSVVSRFNASFLCLFAASSRRVTVFGTM